MRYCAPLGCVLGGFSSAVCSEGGIVALDVMVIVTWYISK